MNRNPQPGGAQKRSKKVKIHQKNLLKRAKKEEPKRHLNFLRQLEKEHMAKLTKARSEEEKFETFSGLQWIRGRKQSMINKINKEGKKR